MKPETILGLSTKFMESRFFLTAAELDIFSLLTRHSISARETAERISIGILSRYFILCSKLRSLDACCS
jgi:hypothetical protein